MFIFYVVCVFFSQEIYLTVTNEVLVIVFFLYDQNGYCWFNIDHPCDFQCYVVVNSASELSSYHH